MPAVTLTEAGLQRFFQHNGPLDSGSSPEGRFGGIAQAVLIP